MGFGFVIGGAGEWNSYLGRLPIGKRQNNLAYKGKIKALASPFASTYSSFYAPRPRG